MPIDPTRRALIEREWRQSSQADAAVISLYPEARDIVINSAFDTEAIASPFSTAMFNMVKVPRRRFQVTIDGALTYKPSSWQGQCPSVTLKSSRYGVAAGLLGCIVGVQWDYQNDQIILEVWG